MNFILDLKMRGALAFSEATEKEFFEEIREDDEEGEEIEEDDTDEPKDVEKIHTVDIVSQVTNKFDTYMKSTNIMWNEYIVNGRIKKSASNYKYIEDLSTILNRTFDFKRFRFVEIFNDLHNMMIDLNMTKSWNLYGRENYGKPYIAEGCALLLYELCVDWAVVITRYYKDNPKFSEDIAPEEDSWFKKFPNLEKLTYIAKLLTESKEFKRLITSEKAKELLKEESVYALNITQAKKKPKLFAMGESLSYYAGLVKEDFGDITVGVLDKLAIVAFLSANTEMTMGERLSIIERLIKTVTAKIYGVDENGFDPLITALESLDKVCVDLFKYRSLATITLESNEKNYPLFIVNR